MAQIGIALSSKDTSEAEKHMGAWLATVITWLHTAAVAAPDDLASVSSRQAPPWNVSFPKMRV